MQRRLRLAGLLLASGATLALAAPNAASAGQATRRPTAAASSSSIMNTSTKRHPFKIKVGKIYDVTARLSGVRQDDRLALEALYRTRLGHPKHWHIIGTWRLHRHERRFRGATRAAFVGLFTLRLQFVRHHHRLRGSQSNRFYVKVKGFHAKKLRIPRHHGGIANDVLRGYNTIQCSTPNSNGTAVELTPPHPWDGRLSGQGLVKQYAFVRDAPVTGGSWSNWYVGAVKEQNIWQDTQPGPFALHAFDETGNSNLLAHFSVGYASDPVLGTGGSYQQHQVAWDIELLGSNGQWQWLNPTFYQAESYVQYYIDNNGNLQDFQSPSCVTVPGPNSPS